MVINPTALLRVIGALAPLMSNREVGEQMVVEVKAVFDAINSIPVALNQIAQQLNRIEQKLSVQQGLPLSEIETTLLLEHVNGSIPNPRDKQP